MPRKPNLACRVCAKPMWSGKGTLPQGEAACRDCRKGGALLPHGRGRYRRAGCRCQACRDAVAKSMRDYTARRKARTGYSSWTSAKVAQAEAEGRTYVPYADRGSPCPVCGELAVKRDASSPVPAMHRDCRFTPEGRAVKRRALGIESPMFKRFRAKMARAAKGRPASKRVFVQGPCAWCETPFCAAAGRYCSDRCKVRARKASRSPEVFNPTPALRASVYERDGWVCGLCMLPIDKSLSWPHKWSASLDHIVPQSLMLVPDHSARNLRAVHLQCNSMRGDGSNMSEDELRRRAFAEIGGA